MNDLWTDHVWSGHPTKLFLVDETIIVDIKDPKEINFDKFQSNILIIYALKFFLEGIEFQKKNIKDIGREEETWKRGKWPSANEDRCWGRFA